ncbi:hypothetical protein [Myroides injenensis]|uniref:hypothetical protein n=1 Tax=Myroides injenensis TaxID=1183151 RepID=UPI0002899478|nr:hypothetical protein [Myroides injenensis]
MILKKFLLLIIIFTPLIYTNAQEAKETLQSHSEISVGLLFVGYSYETPVVDKLTVKGNLDYQIGFAINSDYIKYFSAFSLGIEPRYYYNINNRIRKGKNTKNNAANFFSFEASYQPDFLKTFDYEEYHVKAKDSYNLVPSWNIRRNINNSNFTYEIKLGIGFSTIYYDDLPNEKLTYPAINAKISYNF